MEKYLTIGNTSRKAKVIKSIPVVVNSISGKLVTYEIENYPGTFDYFEPDSTMTDGAIISRRSRSMIPPEYVYKRTKDFDWNLYNSEVSKQKDIANKFILSFNEFRKQGRGLYIYSKTKGSGKTLLACCLANEIIKRYDVSVKFISVTDYIDLLTRKGECEREIVDNIRNCTLLIFDDIGAESEGKDWIRSALFGLIDFRYKNHLSTLYTSNCTLPDLKIDERITDRIHAVSTPLAIPEKSIRREIATKFTNDFMKSLE